MEKYKYELIESAVVILVFILSKIITKRLIYKVGKRFKYQSSRIKITNKLSNILLIALMGIVFTIIWGIDQSEVILFLSTIVTIIGVAFFAQWSLLSNITSALIIFFNHPVKLGDHLIIMDKDFAIEGYLSDISIFFIIIKTKDGTKVTIPSNVFMQKMVKKIQP